MTEEVIKSVQPLGFPWATQDPFLFCAYHNDDYPAGNAEAGPDESLEGRQIGQDFTVKDGWRMYHGSQVPGFPAHPHRGFETVTLVKSGIIDHADSLGAAGRFGAGDAQWMTAGSGVQHSEMFPLLSSDQRNPLELFQIWLNLPARSKMADPHFSMLWADTIPKIDYRDQQGRQTLIDVLAGSLLDTETPTPPPDSWAAENQNAVEIWTLKMEPGAEWILPGQPAGESGSTELSRSLYFYRGSSVALSGTDIQSDQVVELNNVPQTAIVNGEDPAYLLFLQGRPIAEPVANHGPFVMNTREELAQAVRDYQQTEYGGWPWPSREQVHSTEQQRFARHADGRHEVRPL